MKPIYQASIEDRLADLEHACATTRKYLSLMGTHSSTESELLREGLKPGEFAICDWIVRPRFTEKEQP